MSIRKFPVLIFLVSTAVTMLIGASKKAAPTDIALTDINGKKVRLSGFRGRIVLLTFWATWCGPCREEMPMLVEAEKKWGARGVVFVAVSLDDKTSEKNIPEFLRKFQITFPVWIGAKVDDLAKLHLGAPVPVPDTVFVDEKGMIFARIRGEARRSEVDERLEWVTGDRNRPAPEVLVTHLGQ